MQAGDGMGSPVVEPLASGSLSVIAGVVGVVLLAFSGRYGYHRDELYFIACGQHLAWGYPDQPSLVPLIARMMTAIDSTSLVVLRLPSDIAAAGTVFLTGVIARELGAGRSGQLVAAGSMGISSLLIGSGHLLSTETLTLTAFAALLALSLHILRTGSERLWPVVGVVMGVALMVNDLPVFLALAVGFGVLVTGPRKVLLSPWLWAGAVIALAIWSPYLAWQAHHHFPELKIARSIAAGDSGTSAPRWQIPIQQLYLASPALVPLWIAGLVSLLRADRLRWARSFGIAYLVLLIVFIAIGGKPYYLANMFPLLLAAGAQPSIDWMHRHLRWRIVWWAFAGIGVVIVALITLPIEPVGNIHNTNIVAVNYDAGETIGWPTYVREIATAYRTLPPQPTTIILAENYGEAGAIQRYGARSHLPHVYAVQNAYWLWGPPPADATTALALGYSRQQLNGTFIHVRPLGKLNNNVDVDNDEQGTTLYACSGLRKTWTKRWPQLRDYSG
jgi:4-amino-4-deoxy-L-arabinose transferase-like glycosyltransferase